MADDHLGVQALLPVEQSGQSRGAGEHQAQAGAVDNNNTQQTHVGAHLQTQRHRDGNKEEGHAGVAAQVGQDQGHNQCKGNEHSGAGTGEHWGKNGVKQIQDASGVGGQGVGNGDGGRTDEDGFPAHGGGGHLSEIHQGLALDLDEAEGGDDQGVDAGGGDGAVDGLHDGPVGGEGAGDQGDDHDQHEGQQIGDLDAVEPLLAGGQHGTVKIGQLGEVVLEQVLHGQGADEHDDNAQQEGGKDE